VGQLTWNVKLIQFFKPFLSWLGLFHVNDNGVFYDQKISKLFVSHVEESMARHVDVMEKFIKS
jgi:hypothetical protein